MTKFSGSNVQRPSARIARTTTPVKTTGAAITANGARGFVRDAKSDLFLLAVTNMVGEDTYYETAEQRDARFRNLVHQVTIEDPAFVAKLIPFLRNQANMRSAPVVAAAEYVKAGGPNGRTVVSSALQRADEPGEMIGYWLATYGRAIPAAVKRGVADAAVRLYNERNLLKYDGQSKGVRFADVIDLTHPKPSAPWQSALFKHAIDRRHNRDDLGTVLESLPAIAADISLQSLPADQRWANIDTAIAAGWQWERLLSWLPDLGKEGNKAKAWEAIFPNLGYMALLRNLRNMEEAGVSQATIDKAVAKLADPDEVARSKQFPFRFLSAHKNTHSLHWGAALEKAVNHSTVNIPALRGKTLVLIDVSGSMAATLSEKSSVERWEAGALFAYSMAKKAGVGQVRLVAFGTTGAELTVSPNGSVLRQIEQFRSDYMRTGRLGHSTNAFGTLDQFYKGEERVVIFTDEQVNPHRSRVQESVPLLYTFNLAGYGVAATESGKAGRHTFGGFSDASFKMMDLVEKYQSSGWDALLG